MRRIKFMICAKEERRKKNNLCIVHTDAKVSCITRQGRTHICTI